MNYIISVDMGGTKIQAAAVNSDKGILNKVKVPTGEGDSEYYLQKVADVIEETIKDASLKQNQIKAIAIGIPGMVSPSSGEIYSAPNLKVKNYNFKEKLQKLIPYEVLLENDVNLAALGIKHFGVGKKAENMLVAFIGTGIGGGLILNNKLYRGSLFAAGELGHIKAAKTSPQCGCGNYGCIEALASRTAMERFILRDYNAGEQTVLSKIIDKKKPIKSKALKNAVKKKDPLVIRTITEACQKIGVVLSNVNNLLNLDMIVLGGGVIEALDKFMMPIITEAFMSKTLEVAGREVKIVATKLGDEAPLYGGLALAEEILGVKY